MASSSAIDVTKTHQRAAQFWPVLVVCAYHRLTISYTHLGKFTGMPQFTLGDKHDTPGVLGLLVRYCEQNNLPKLTSIIVSDVDGQPVDKVEDRATVRQQQAEVFRHDWLNEHAPSAEDFQAQRVS